MICGCGEIDLVPNKSPFLMRCKLCIGTGSGGVRGRQLPPFFGENCFFSTNIILFGQINRSHQIDQSGKFVFDHGRKYYRVSVAVTP